MLVHVADHPLITHKLTLMRDETTPSPVFRELVEELVTLLAYEATRHVSVRSVKVQTPVAMADGVKIAKPRPVIIPILRAGLGMLNGMVKLLPTAEVGFLGIKRDEATLMPYTYATRLPDDLNGRQVFLIDPMLATGGTLVDSIKFCVDRGATDITAVCLIASPEGIEILKTEFENVDLRLVIGALDEKLNEHGYIVPGLGDAGDRLYGIAD